MEDLSVKREREEKLKLCPFCGGKGQFCYTNWDFKNNRPEAWSNVVVECKSCGAYGEEGVDEFIAMENWNKRVE